MKKELKGFADLKRDIVDVGLCEGCGACSGFCPLGILTHAGDECEPVLDGKCKPCGICYKVCGGKYVNLPEMERALFGRQRDLNHPFEHWFGIYRECLVGHSNDNELRKGGAAGAMASALMIFALETGKIDVALLTGMDKKQPWRAAPMIATNAKEVLPSQQSKYQMAPTLTLLSALAKDYNHIGVVGLPCQIWPMRKAMHVPGAKKIAEKVVFTVGILCAAQYYFMGTVHLLKEWCGIENVEDVTELQYRGGTWPGSFIVKTRDGREVSHPQRQYKYHHLIPYYQRDRCTMCLDYSADVADVSVGDIWTLSEPGELGGLNQLLVRTESGEKMVREAERQGYISVKPLDPTMMFHCGVGFKSKLISNTYRFANRIRFGWPVPDYGFEPTGYRKPYPAPGRRGVWSK